MSATLFFQKAIGPNARWFHIGLYLLKSFCLTVGGALIVLKQADWDSMWIAMKMGWVLLLLGNLANTWAAALSGSTRAKSEPKQTP